MHIVPALSLMACSTDAFVGTLGTPAAAAQPILRVHGGGAATMLRVRGGSATMLHNHAQQAANILGNVRTPAALVAGACLPLGFAFAFPTKEDTKSLRALKRLNVLLAFLSVNSELLSVGERDRRSKESEGDRPHL